MVVSPTPSRLVTLGESTPEENTFMGLFCESSGLRPRVDSSLIKSRLLKKNISGTVLYINLVLGYESALPYHESTPEGISVLPMFCDISALRLWVGSSLTKSRLLKKMNFYHSSVKIIPQTWSHFLNLRVDSWRSTPEEWSSDMPPIRPETLSFLPRTCVHYM